MMRWMALGALALLCAACSTGESLHTSQGSPTNTGTAGLRAAATAWSNAFLTGTVADIRSMQGTQCLTTPHVTPKVLAGYLQALQAEMEHQLRVPLHSIRITGVQVRDVTATTGDAEVQYALPASVVGNDNWVAFAYQNGQWRVTNCNAPIGGESSSASASSL
jgi:hypothetical protein